MADKVGLLSYLFQEFAMFVESFVSTSYCRGRSFFDAEWKETSKERFCTDLSSEKKNNEDLLWFHAASVGEVNGIAPLIQLVISENDIKKNGISEKILITTTSLTGRRRAKELWPQAIVRLLPVGSKSVFSKFLTFFNPRILIINETELWPVMINVVRKAKIPSGIVNARLSDRSFPQYRKFRFFFSPLLRSLDFIFAQSLTDKDRFIEIGAYPGSIESIGSTKYDVKQEDVKLKVFFDTWKNTIKSQDHRSMIYTAGSVREDEEDIIISSFCELKKNIESFFMIIAPRHPDRFDEVAKKLEKASISFLRKSTIPDEEEYQSAEVPEVLLLDTFGDLSNAYQISDCAFVGGTLCPVGGHNILEPAVFGTPVIVGPYTMNVRPAVDLLRETGAFTQVEDRVDLENILRSFFLEKSKLDILSESTKEAADKARGVSKRLYEKIMPYIS